MPSHDIWDGTYYPKPTGGNALDRLIERKQMSTKTTFKRVALVAVASLGFGVLTSVAPASATNEANSVVTAVSVTAQTTPPRVGVAQTTTFSIVNTAGTAGTVEFAAIITAKPATSLLNDYTGAAFTNAGEALAGTATGAATAGDTATARGPKYIITASTLTANLSTAPGVAGSLTFTPDVAGTYKITVFSDFDGNGNLASGAKSATWTVVAAGAPATATVSVVNPAAAGTTTTTHDIIANNQGALVKVVLKDVNGYATAPRGAEVVTLTSNTTTALNKTNAAQLIQLTSSNVELSGTYFGNYTDTAAETVIFSTVGSGSLSAVTGLTASSTATYALPTAVVTGLALSDTTGVSATAISGTRDGSPAITAITATKAAVSLKVSSAAATKVAVTVSDASGDLTGAVNATFGYSVIVTTVSDLATVPTFFGTLSVPMAGLTAGVANGAVTVFGHTATANDDLAAAFTPALGGTVAAPTALVASQIATVAGVVVVTTTVKDSYGIALANASVTFKTSVLSRNAGLTSTTITNALGIATFTLTDVSTSTTVFADSVSISASYAGTTASTTGAATITWKTTLGVSTVKMTSDDYTVAGTANTSVSPQAISVGATGAQAGARTITAVVKDAGGVVIIGAPVTFSVAGTTAAIPSNKVIAYTDATGTATSSVYAWATGTYTVTATVGGVSGTATETFNSVSGAERVISATATGNVVTGKAVDRFGNPVLGVTLYATVTAGNGYFGNTGLKTASTPTLANGTATFVLTGDASTVTVSNVNPASVAGATIGQTSGPKGYLTNAVTNSATVGIFTATTVGTTTTAELGVGASFDAAGVSSATAEVTADTASAQSQAAADAAAEATDAANAATDAANAAAEAADAATAAAQDAADAVAALSTQVSEMVNALKKQITALTNLVIKIQKKVKA
jgi:trimeric autotransporter adhesin